MKSIVLTFSFFLIMTGCGTPENSVEEIQTKTVEAEPLSFTVDFPLPVERNEAIEVTGTMENISEEAITVTHARPPIMFELAGQGNGREDIALETELAPGERLTFTKEFVLEKEGTFELEARTTYLQVDGEDIDGTGNERYIDESMSQTMRQVERSKLSLPPIKIKVEK